MEQKNIQLLKFSLFIFIFGMFFLNVLTISYADNEGVDSSYVLQVGDRIDVKIYPEDEYLKGGEAEVSSQGFVTVPLVGKIRAENKSVLDVEKEITEILARDYIANPQVVIEVLEYQQSSFVVLGQVSKPGSYPLPVAGRKMTLLSAISLAGGFNDIANIKKLKIMRKSTGDVLRVNVENIISGNQSDIEIVADDVVHVSESLF